MKFQRMSVAMLTAAAGISSSASLYAASDMFLKIDGIDGESTADKFKGQSDVISWAWGAASTANGKKGCVQDMDIRKTFDSASPALISNAATAAVAPKAVLTLVKAGGEPLQYLVITMTNVRVASYQVASSSGGLPAEDVTLNFDTMSGVYKKQKPDGTLDAGIPWNIGPNPGKCP